MARPAKGYMLESGERAVGVTTVLSMLNKPALIGWAGKLCAEAGWQAHRNGEPIPRWTDICYGTRDRAASDGTRAHDLFEQYLLGHDVKRSETDTDGAWTAFENAKQWKEGLSIKFEVWPHERPLIDERLKLGGTPDATGCDGDIVTLCDWKTGGVYVEHICQLAAYRYLLWRCEHIAVSGAHLVRFHREHGDFHHHYFADDALDAGWKIFKHLLIAYPQLKELEKRVK